MKLIGIIYHSKRFFVAITVFVYWIEANLRHIFHSCWHSDGIWNDLTKTFFPSFRIAWVRPFHDHACLTLSFFGDDWWLQHLMKSGLVYDCVIGTLQISTSADDLVTHNTIAKSNKQHDAQATACTKEIIWSQTCTCDARFQIGFQD